MLYLEISPNTFAPWQGEPINGIRYPRAIATNWSDEDLAAIGLYRPADADPVPEGKTVTGQSVQRVAGVVRWVYDLADAPEPSLEDRKAALTQAAYAKCEAVITGGFVSTALGSLHVYPSKIVDQINLMGSVTASLLPGLPEDWSTAFWCADAADVWLMREHEAGQIQQAGRDGKAHVLDCQMHLDGLVNAIAAAADHDALDLIDIEAGWPA